MDPQRPPQILLQTSTAAGSIWWRGADPVEILVAEDAGDVVDVLAAAEQATRRGCFAVGFLTYEAAPAFDRAFAVRRPGPLPAAWFAVFQRLDELPALPGTTGSYRLGEWRASLTPRAHASRVDRIRRAIARGDTYQANLTYRLRADFHGDTLALFGDLWRAQRPSHAAYLDLADHAVLSVSPELFFAREGERVRCRPMKGTAGRGRTTAEDARRAEALRASAKDRAENLMIVDMVRNDLGRVAEPGSVEVPELFTLERYPSLWQLTSTVEARTRASTAEILAALFPCASITGAPKVRTMEILSRLEDSPRGIYTGTIGWMAPGNRASFNVAIRTVHVDHARELAEYGTGGGIVWDSRPASELEETRTKAAILFERPPAFELLETLAWRPASGYRLLRRHLDRLADSAAYFGIPCDLQRCREELAAAVRELPPRPRRVRLMVSQSGGVRVQAALDDGLESGVERGPRRSWRLAFAPQPVDAADPFLFHKTTRRDLYERARAARPGYDDVLLWNPAGVVTETTVANLLARVDGRWVTPPLSAGLLPGILRAALLARRCVAEAPLSAADLERAEIVLLVNSVRGIIPVDIDWATAPSALVLGASRKAFGGAKPRPAGTRSPDRRWP